MAGHSKWANIKRRKGAQDAKKAKIFAKLAREIVVAVQQGGAETEKNARLRLAIQHAKACNFPKENIVRVIQKTCKESSKKQYKKVLYGGRAHGVGVLVETITDNINRTVADVRSMFNKYGGVLDKKESIGHLFDYQGVFIMPKEATHEWETHTYKLIDIGMTEITHEEDHVLLTCLPVHFKALQQYIEAQQLPLVEAGLKYVPHTMANINVTKAKQVTRMLDALISCEDVQEVYHNMEHL